MRRASGVCLCGDLRARVNALFYMCRTMPMPPDPFAHLVAAAEISGRSRAAGNLTWQSRGSRQQVTQLAIQAVASSRPHEIVRVGPPPFMNTRSLRRSTRGTGTAAARFGRDGWQEYPLGRRDEAADPAPARKRKRSSKADKPVKPEEAKAKARPRGRAPKGQAWNASTGEWEPKSGRQRRETGRGHDTDETATRRSRKATDKTEILVAQTDTEEEEAEPDQAQAARVSADAPVGSASAPGATVKAAAAAAPDVLRSPPVAGGADVPAPVDEAEEAQRQERLRQERLKVQATKRREFLQRQAMLKQKEQEEVRAASYRVQPQQQPQQPQQQPPQRKAQQPHQPQPHQENQVVSMFQRANGSGAIAISSAGLQRGQQLMRTAATSPEQSDQHQRRRQDRQQDPQVTAAEAAGDDENGGGSRASAALNASEPSRSLSWPLDDSDRVAEPVSLHSEQFTVSAFGQDNRRDRTIASSAGLLGGAAAGIVGLDRRPASSSAPAAQTASGMFGKRRSSGKLGGGVGISGLTGLQDNKGTNRSSASSGARHSSGGLGGGVGIRGLETGGPGRRAPKAGLKPLRR